MFWYAFSCPHEIGCTLPLQVVLDQPSLVVAPMIAYLNELIAHYPGMTSQCTSIYHMSSLTISDPLPYLSTIQNSWPTYVSIKVVHNESSTKCHYFVKLIQSWSHDNMHEWMLGQTWQYARVNVRTNMTICTSEC
jgi:hypothetical protein